MATQMTWDRRPDLPDMNSNDMLDMRYKQLSYTDAAGETKTFYVREIIEHPQTRWNFLVTDSYAAQGEYGMSHQEVAAANDFLEDLLDSADAINTAGTDDPDFIAKVDACVGWTRELMAAAHKQYLAELPLITRWYYRLGQLLKIDDYNTNPPR